MVDRSAIREHMDVIDSEGQAIGRVNSVDGTRIKLTRKDSPDGRHHYVEFGDIAPIDSHVHLSRPAAAVLGAGAALSANDRDDRAGAGKRANWLP